MGAHSTTQDLAPLAKTLISLTRHLKQGLPSIKVCQAILSDRGHSVDSVTVRKLVNTVIAYRRKKIADGESEETVGKPCVNTELIIARSKGKVVAQLPLTSEQASVKKKKKEPEVVSETVKEEIKKAVKEEIKKTEEEKPAPVIHSRPTARYGTR